jgi:hypothetical protein
MARRERARRGGAGQEMRAPEPDFAQAFWHRFLPLHFDEGA